MSKLGVWRYGLKDEKNGKPIPRYIVHGGPELSVARGLDSNICLYFDEPPTSDEHRKNLEAMWARWVDSGAEHVYPNKR